MKYAGYMPNDFLNGSGVSVSLWVQGCPFHCEGCHNSNYWNYNDGHEVPSDLKGQLIKAISENNITRNFSILGGQPLAEYNIEFVSSILKAVRMAYPKITIFLWTGYTIEEIKMMNNYCINQILKEVDVLIDGRYEQQKRDITLLLRGSSNQRILFKGKDF